MATPKAICITSTQSKEIEIVCESNESKRPGHRKETVNKDLSPYITASVKTWEGGTKTITGPQTDIKDTCACRPTHPSDAQNTQRKLQKLSHFVFPEKKKN